MNKRMLDILINYSNKGDDKRENVKLTLLTPNFSFTTFTDLQKQLNVSAGFLNRFIVDELNFPNFEVFKYAYHDGDLFVNGTTSVSTVVTKTKTATTRKPKSNLLYKDFKLDGKRIIAEEEIVDYFNRINRTVLRTSEAVNTVTAIRTIEPKKDRYVIYIGINGTSAEVDKYLYMFAKNNSEEEYEKFKGRTLIISPKEITSQKYNGFKKVTLEEVFDKTYDTSTIRWEQEILNDLTTFVANQLSLKK